MKFIITESRIKNFLKLNGIDLEGKIRKIDSWEELPKEFKKYISHNIFNTYLEHYRDAYIIEYGFENFLYQKRDLSSVVVTPYDRAISERDFLDKLGVPVGISLDDIIRIYT